MREIKDIKVGLITCGNGVGDTIISIKALYIAKTLYGAKCVLFGEKIAHTLCAGLDFIDEVVVLPYNRQGFILNQYQAQILAQNKELNATKLYAQKPKILSKPPRENSAKIDKKANKIATQNLIDTFDSHHLDYLIVSSPRSINIALAKSTNAKKILCATKLTSLFSPKCKTLPIYAKKDTYKKVSFEEILCLFVRMINPKIYDENISSLDFAPTALATTQAHKSRIAEFLHKQKLSKHLILLNPFSVSGLYSLSKNAFLDIVARVQAKYSDCTCIIATYPKVHSEFVHLCDKYPKKLKNLLIFPNDDDIFNLIELCKRVSCVITPSTGVAHIAANVGTPTVALYGKQDINRWILGGGGGVAHSYTKARYVLLEQNLSYLIAHPSEEAHYIDKVVESLKEVLQSES